MYGGFYRAKVVDTNDPEGRGRVRLLIPSIFGANPTGWAAPMLFNVPVSKTPAVDEPVMAAFENGDAGFPLYLWVPTDWAFLH